MHGTKFSIYKGFDNSSPNYQGNTCIGMELGSSNLQQQYDEWWWAVIVPAYLYYGRKLKAAFVRHEKVNLAQVAIKPVKKCLFATRSSLRKLSPLSLSLPYSSTLVSRVLVS